MDLRHLRLFLALADCMDLAKAAKQCGLTPSAFGRQVGEMEERLGITLFHKRGSRITLSGAGQVFLGRAKEILACAESVIDEAKATEAAAQNSIRLGHYGQWWSRRYAAPLKRFQAKNPGVRVHSTEFMSAELADCLKGDRIDMALLEYVDLGLRIDFCIKRIEMLPTVVLVSATHALAKRKRVSFADLGGETWVVWDERVFPGRRTRFLDAAQSAGCVPCLAWEAESEAALFDHVLGGGAIGCAPDVLGPLPPRLVAVDLRPSILQYPVYLAWRRDSDNLAQLNSLAECLLK